MSPDTDVIPEVLTRIDVLDGSVTNGVPEYRSIRARLPLVAVEGLAELEAVQWIRPADQAVTGRQAGGILAAFTAGASDQKAMRKQDTSEGDVAHRADQARLRFGVDGTGIGIGVLSDGVDSLADRQASGDLPATVTILPGQAGAGDEGTALLEVVHDLAPGAKLYYATALGGQAQFAMNIEALCREGADVIVDDVSYFDEAVFQDGTVSQGVNAATANGCIHFSAAGNAGNRNDNTSGVWEGDFEETPGRVNEVPAAMHSFGQTWLNRIAKVPHRPERFRITLKWSDPLGASRNDYDLYLVDPTPNTDGTYFIRGVSNSTQNGSQDPVEMLHYEVCRYALFGICIFRTTDITDYNLVIVKADGHDRYLHLNTNRGRLAIATEGQIYGHSAAVTTVGVAATSVTGAAGVGRVFNGTESVERFSSDGPRRIFFRADGQAITPGNFSSTGGQVLRKPDVTAADGVSTATPGFRPFSGTSAAAPHAAAIAALMLHAAGGPGSLTREQLFRAMQETALDIEAPNWDRDSGAGIIDAVAAVSKVAADEGGLTPGSTTRAVHLTELRVRINAARRQCGLTNVAWTEPNIVPGVTTIKAMHITQSRNALDAAFRACGRTPPSWTDPQIVPGVTFIKAVHFMQMRDAVQALAGSADRMGRR